MKRFWLATGALAAFGFPALTFAAVFTDDFYGSIMSSTSWHIPTWVSPTDGTYVGRTQFRTSQNAPLPSIVNGSAQIKLETYNPTGFSFYGTDAITNQTFTLQPGQGLDVSFRAKMDNPTAGTVGGLFLYALKPGSNTLHDEIDFELLGNRPNEVQTNIYGNEPLGVGHPGATSYPAGGSIGEYHTYRFTWFADKVSWYVDGTLVRTATSQIPTGPMYLHLNMWAPAADWTNAYSANIQPTNSAASNTVWTMSVDSVVVNTVAAPLTPSASFTNTPTCTVTAGSYTCPATISWTSANPSNGLVGLYKCGASTSSWTSMSGAQSSLQYLNPSRTCWQIRNMSDGKVLAQTGASVGCATGSTWRSSQTLNSDAGMCVAPNQASFTGGSSCTVPVGGTFCTTNLSWTSLPSGSNLVTLLKNGGWVTVSGTGPQSRSVNLSPSNWDNIELRDTSSNVYLTSVLGIARCAYPSTWNGSSCR